MWVLLSILSREVKCFRLVDQQIVDHQHCRSLLLATLLLPNLLQVHLHWAMDPLANLHLVMDLLANHHPVMDPLANLRPVMDPLANLHWAMGHQANHHPAMDPLANLRPVMDPLANLHWVMGHQANLHLATFLRGFHKQPNYPNCFLNKRGQ
jgi:hypothetical protein